MPKGKGNGGPPNFHGGKGWGKGNGKKGKGKDKISDVDEQGWQHVGASSADWNWAAGSEWGNAAEAVPGWPPAATQWTRQLNGHRQLKQPRLHGWRQLSLLGRRALPAGLPPPVEPQQPRQVFAA